MSDTFQRSGQWWLPGDYNNRIGGVIAIEEGIELKVKATGALPRPKGVVLIRVPIVHGSTERHDRVTLIRVYESVGPPFYSSSGYTGSEISAEVAFVGAHLDEDEPRFDSMTVLLTNLNNWCNIDRGIEQSFEDGKQRIIAGLGDGRDAIDSEVSDGVRVSLRFENRPVFAFDHSSGVTSVPVFRIEFRDGATIDQYEEVARRLQEMISLFVHSPVYVQQRWATVSRTSIDDSGSQTSGRIYRRYTRRPRRPPKEVWPSGMMTALSQIEDELPSVIKKWIEDGTRFGSAYHKYFSVAFGRPLAIEKEFATYVEALEGFHRRSARSALTEESDERASDDRYVPKDTYRAIVKKVVECFPDDISTDLRQNMKSWLGLANTWSLRHRLRQILANRSDQFRFEYFGGEQELETWIERVAGTRDDLIHSLAPGDVDDRFQRGTHEFVVATEQLQVLVEAYLLEMSGFTSDQIEAFLRNRPADLLVPRTAHQQLRTNVVAQLDDRHVDPTATNDEPSP